jgi:hypothetical protein
MMRKTILLILCICCCQLITSAQLPRPAAPPSEPSRLNSVYLGVSGGLSIPFSSIAETHTIGGFGQAEIFVFVTENITVGADLAYHYFPSKKDTLADIAMQEVLINGAFYFESSWNPHISLGLGYYGEPGASHFGMVPKIGIMPKITNRIYFTAQASANFFDMDGHFFKVGAGIIFMVFQHKPIKR